MSSLDQGGNGGALFVGVTDLLEEESEDTAITAVQGIEAMAKRTNFRHGV